MEDREPRGWYSRGYLPHFDAAKVTQFITFHLGDSLPLEIVARWKEGLRHLPEGEQKSQLRSRVMKYLDLGIGACWLARPEIASLVEDGLKHFDCDRYRLLSWTVMPNHVHVLIALTGTHTMPSIIHSWKSFTSSRANKILERSGEFWYREYYDRFIRDEEHYRNVVAYIDRNPVKARLCEQSADWPFGSARLVGQHLEGLQDAGDAG